MKIKIQISKKELATIMTKTTVKTELKLDSEKFAKTVLKDING